MARPIRSILTSVIAIAAMASAAEAQRTTESKPVTPYWGNISPFYGNISPFYGNISPFYGNISPFYGNISPFWGNISPFWGNISPFYGNISPFWGNISPFGGKVGTAGSEDPKWNAIGTFWTDVGTRWGALNTNWVGVANPDATQLQDYATGLRGIVDSSAGFWGEAVRTATGKDFAGGFANPLLAKYGIDLDKPSSLAGLSAARRSQFFLEWYDRLMDLSGADRVDHWMSTVRWTPALSQQQSVDKGSVIGLLDFTVADPSLGKTVQKFSGISTFNNGHGEAVASLMVSPQDGRGVMGIAPNSTVIGYNPFDSTGTANWADVTTGVAKLADSEASIINMSLGVPGWTLHPEWNAVFAKLKLFDRAATAYVIAAGNDGRAQTQNVPWSVTNPSFILVGSIDPNEVISDFSNRPGTACLTTLGLCLPGSRLMDRFIVAPGELMLVSDGKGGTMRVSGTSFAAPLVSATIALLHDRWPWLANFPKQSVDIVLKSARDLGAPGTDPVYGVGVLDVAAAQAPLDVAALKWYSSPATGKGTPKEQPLSLVGLSAPQINKWLADGVTVYAFEDLGGTYRDFAVPLSSKLVGAPTGSGIVQQQLQQYVLGQIASAPATLSSIIFGRGRGFVGFAGTTSAVANPYGMDIQMRIAPRRMIAGYRQSSMPYQTALRLADPEGRFGLTAGAGDGAVELGGARAFGLASDYDGDQGGVNPVLGMASGGAFASASFAPNERLRLSAGVTQLQRRRDLQDAGIAQQLRLGGVRDNDAAAQHVAIDYRLSEDLTISGSYTRLQERAALLGVQSIDRGDFAGGNDTDGLTLGGDLALGDGLHLAASGTMGRTRAGRGTLTATGAGIVTSAFRIAASKDGVLDRADRLRLSFSQPMHVERGQLALESYEVIDRRTAELGVVTRRFDIGGARRQLIAEANYARAVLDGAAELGLFARARMQTGQSTDPLPGFIGGASFRVVIP